MGIMIGLDLGQSRDFAAMAIVRKSETGIYDVPEIGRFPLGTPYPAIVEQVTQMLKRPEMQGSALIVDATGVGRPVVDLFRHHLHGLEISLRPITLTAGHTVRHSDDGFERVPKRQLIVNLQTLLATHRLRIPRHHPFTRALIEELQSYQVQITPHAHETFTARSGHDDLVIALGLGVGRVYVYT